jgi:hypothetical protein
LKNAVPSNPKQRSRGNIGQNLVRKNEGRGKVHPRSRKGRAGGAPGGAASRWVRRRLLVATFRRAMPFGRKASASFLKKRSKKLLGAVAGFLWQGAA